VHLDHTTVRGGAELALVRLLGDWGYIDLHRRFPGIGIDDQAAFEMLWRDRVSATAAGRAIPVPSRAAQGVLLVLNAARGTSDDREAAAAFRRGLTGAGAVEHDALVAMLDAAVAASVVAGELERWRDHRMYPLWKSVTEGGSRTREWWGRVRGARTPREALRVMLRAPRVNRSRLAHQLGRPPTSRDVVAAATARAARRARAAARKGATVKVAIAEDVGVVEHEGIIYVSNLPDGPIFVLTDEAAAVWRSVGGPRPLGPDQNDYLKALVAAELLVIEKDA